MLTPTKRICHLKRALLSLGFFTLFTHALYASQPLIIERSLSSYQTITIPLELNANDYVSGEYKTSARINHITLVDEDKTPIRRLSEPYTLEERFIFTVLKKGRYALVIEALEHESRFTCNLEIRAAQPQQHPMTQEELISPTLLKMQGISDTKTFWEEIKRVGTPLIEEHDDGTYILSFVYQGARNNVQIMGAPIGDIAYMNKMIGNDIWYKSFRVPKGTRLSYQLAPDVPQIIGTPRERRIAILATLQADPFNKTPMRYTQNEDTFHKMSTVVLPHPLYKEWSNEHDAPHGIIKSYTVASKLLNNQRDIDIYLPKGFSKENHYPVLFLFDGKEYQSKVQTPIMLDNLIADKKIPPLIAVFISNPSYKSRALELPCNPLLADFMAKELLPWFKQTITPNVTAQQSILSGSSYGGLASAYTAFRYPDLFGNVLSLSGSFWWKADTEEESQWLTRELAKSNPLPVSFYLYAGRFETGQSSIDILESNRHLRTVLHAKKSAVFYEEFMGGHDYFSWDVALSDGLIRILNPENASLDT